jgi:hypothetical protein
MSAKPIKRPRWFTCFSEPDACSDPALCTMNCTQWEDPFECQEIGKKFAAYQGDDMSLPRNYRQQDSLDLDEAEELVKRDDVSPLMKDIARQLIARRKREQAETDEARERLYSPEAQQAREQSDKLP